MENGTNIADTPVIESDTNTNNGQLDGSAEPSTVDLENDTTTNTDINGGGGSSSVSPVLPSEGDTDTSESAAESTTESTEVTTESTTESTESTEMSTENNGSVSDNDINADIENALDTVIKSVSDNQIMMKEYATSVSVDTHTIWDKPINDYTVTEGLLLLIFIFLLVIFVGKMVIGGGKYV